MKATTTLVLISFLLPLNSEAQFYKDMSVGLNGGIYVYQGDLTPQALGSFKTIQPGFSFFAKKPINHFLAARLHVSIANLKGDDSRYTKPEYRQQRNFYFTSSLKEFSGQLVWNIRGMNYEDKGIQPYIFTGAGVSLIRTRKDYSRMDLTVFGENAAVMNGLAADNAHGSPRALFSVPVGVGAEYPISPRFSVNLETSYRFIFTDYLDGFSQSANPKLKDHYHSTSVGLIYKFGNKDKGIGCPVVNP
ncbi:MAG: outer membrane beta-barrel protein [Ferruginibacter sp.]|nr:outer membrane beta-barrel protein [Ferruginibacter sp.]